jgi:outer membrane protein assembly factor BamB
VNRRTPSRSFLGVAALAASLTTFAACGSTAPAKQVTYQLAWSARLDENADSSPLIAHASGKAVLLVLAANNDSDCRPENRVRHSTTYAFNPSTGRVIWSQTTDGPSRCSTSVPAVSGHWVYVPGFDGAIHRYDVTTGREFKGPIDPSNPSGASFPIPFTVSPNVEKASSPLRIFGNVLYVTASGYTAHPGRYHGHLVAINLKTGATTIWNDLCSDNRTLMPATGPKAQSTCPVKGGGIWSRTGVQRDPANGNIVLSTGNGPWNGRTNWSDSVVEFTPGASHLLGSFTPTNYAYLGTHDDDLGSSGPAILPPIEWDHQQLHLALIAGKGPAGADGGPAVVWLLNRDLWAGAPGIIGRQLAVAQTPGGCDMLTAPAIWTRAGQTSIIYANDCGATSYSVRVSSGGHARLVTNWHIGTSAPFTTPVIANNTLYVARDGAVLALNPATGKRLWSSASTAHTIGAVHWEFPSVSGRWLFMTDETGHLYAFQRTR